MSTWLLAIAPLLAVLISFLGYVSQRRAKKEQHKIREAVDERERRDAERTQQWREMTETVETLSAQYDLANTRLLQCQDREAQLRKRLDRLEGFHD